MVPFGGWDMPVQYRNGIISEVRSVRNSAGMFDVSHMGRVEFSGASAEAFLGSVLSVDMTALGTGRSKYHVICNEQGGIIDDAIVYRLGDQKFLLVINAGNAEADLAWLLPRAHSRGNVHAEILTERIAMVAVQGPQAVEIVDRLSGSTASKIKRFSLGDAEVVGIPARLARTGYTGEDGFEIMAAAGRAVELWNKLAEAGVAMCGLGARDVLRLEAGLMLHGNDMAVDNNPFEAGLERFAYIENPDYVAADALRQIRSEGTDRTITGFKMVEPGIPRHGMKIIQLGSELVTAGPDGRRIGIVTSGTHSPTLDAAIGMGYVDRRFAAVGTRISIDVRGKLVEAEVVPLPFYSRKKT